MVRKRKNPAAPKVDEYTIKSNDGHVEVISAGVMRQSNTLNHCLKLTQENGVIPLPCASGAVLKVVFAFCRLHESDPPYVRNEVGPSALSFVDAVFLRQHEKVFNELIQVGDYLDIPRLVDAVLLYIRDNYVAGQSFDIIAKHLGVPPRTNFGAGFDEAVQEYSSLLR